jgi:hypothetical protein
VQRPDIGRAVVRFAEGEQKRFLAPSGGEFTEGKTAAALRDRHLRHTHLVQLFSEKTTLWEMASFTGVSVAARRAISLHSSPDGQRNISGTSPHETSPQQSSPMKTALVHTAQTGDAK